MHAGLTLRAEVAAARTLGTSWETVGEQSSDGTIPVAVAAAKI